MEIESAQNFTETPSAEGASSSKEMQEQDTHAGAVPVISNAIANDGSELDRGSHLHLLVCLLNVTQFSTCSFHAVIYQIGLLPVSTGLNAIHSVV